MPDVSKLRDSSFRVDDTSTTAVWIYHGNKLGYLRADPEVLSQLEATSFSALWSDTIGVNGKMHLSGDHSVYHRRMCEINQMEYAGACLPKLWYHSACIDAIKDTDERLTKHSKTYGKTVRYDCPCCEIEMQVVVLDENGTFPSGSICEKQRPRNMINEAGKINIVAGAGNYVARYTYSTNNTEPDLTNRPPLLPQMDTFDYRQFLKWKNASNY